MPQQVVAHAVAAQQFQGCGDCALFRMTSRTCSPADKMIRHSDAKHLDRGHAANVRYLWRQTFSVLALAVSESRPDYSRLPKQVTHWEAITTNEVREDRELKI